MSSGIHLPKYWPAGEERKHIMKKHVSYDKLSKKKQIQIDKEKRGTWFGINPVTRKPESSRAYNRRKAQDWKKDSGPALFLCP